MGMKRALAAATLALLLAACGAHSPPDAGEAPATPPASDAAADATHAADPARVSPAASGAHDPNVAAGDAAGVGDAAGTAQAAVQAPRIRGGVDYGCSTDADCTVKDVGSCCGYAPACVNTDSPTFPGQVKAECGKQGMASTCGFQEIAGCQCVEGLCTAVSGLAPAAPPTSLE